MNKAIKLFAGLAVLLVVGLLSNIGAQYSQSSILVRGTYIDVRLVTASSTTATAIFPVDNNRVDGICRVNGNYTVWIGTVSSTMQTSHTNIVKGFNLLPYDIYKIDGKLAGIQYATCDTGVASCELRCLDGKVYP